MIALLLCLAAALAGDPAAAPDDGPKRTPSRGVPGMPSPSEILWGGELEALFQVHDGDLPVGVGHWGWPTLDAPATTQLCVLDLTVTPDGETTVEKRWCEGALADAVDPGPWKLVAAEGQTAPLSRRITLYAFPDGRVVGALYGTAAADRASLPDRFAYGDAPTVVRSAALPDPASGQRAEAVECRFRLLVDEKGRTRDAAVDACPDDLAALALPVLRKWRHDPARVLGEAVAAELIVPWRYEPAAAVVASAEGPATDAGGPPEGSALWLGYGTHPRLAVLQWTLPAAPAVTEAAHCEVHFDFRGGEHLTFIDGCDGAWKAAVEAAVASWRFGAVDAALRYRIGLYALPDGTVRAALWGVDEAARTALPEGFVYGEPAEAARRANLPSKDGDGWCALLVRVDAAGQATDVQRAGCAEPHATAIGEVLTSQWRYAPARLEGAAVPSIVEVYVRLGNR